MPELVSHDRLLCVLLLPFAAHLIVFGEVPALLLSDFLHEIFVLGVLLDRAVVDEFQEAVRAIYLQQGIYGVPGLPGDIFAALLQIVAKSDFAVDA